MYDSKNTILDVHTKAKRAFAFKEYSEYKLKDYLAVVVISQKTGRQLNSYSLDVSLADDVKKIRTLSALIDFAKSKSAETVN